MDDIENLVSCVFDTAMGVHVDVGQGFLKRFMSSFSQIDCQSGD